MPGLTLVFDADDTLWQNNVHFERVIADFIRWVDHPVLSATEIRAMFDEIERRRTVTHGYGSRVFRGSLVEWQERLAGRTATAEERLEIDALCTIFEDHRLELFDGVPETLQALARKHTLRLLTKGESTEQQKKIDASRLAAHFASTHIVAEKNPATYENLAEELGLEPADTWMVGNSPKSDILASRAAGWNAVFIPDQHTWVLEEHEINDEQVLQLAAFPELLEHF